MMNQENNIVQDTIIKTTARGRQITVNLELFNSIEIEDRKILSEILKKQKKQLVYPGTTTVQKLKQELEQHTTNNQKIILMCERFVPNPLDTLGDLLATVQKQELTFQLCCQVVTG